MVVMKSEFLNSFKKPENLYFIQEPKDTWGSPRPRHSPKISLGMNQHACAQVHEVCVVWATVSVCVNVWFRQRCYCPGLRFVAWAFRSVFCTLPKANRIQGSESFKKIFSTSPGHQALTKSILRAGPQLRPARLGQLSCSAASGPSQLPQVTTNSTVDRS